MVAKHSYCFILFLAALMACDADENPRRGLSGRVFKEAKYASRSSTYYYPNFTYRDSSFYYDAREEVFFLGSVSEGQYSISGDTLRYLESRITFHSDGCQATSGNYKQSAYNLFKIEGDSIYFRYHYVLDAIGHDGQSLSGRWEYSHLITTRSNGSAIDRKGTRTYYFEFSDSEESLYEFGWRDDFESCFKTNVRYNGYAYDEPFLDMRPLPVHPNLVEVDFRNHKMFWRDAQGFVGFSFTPF